MVYNFLSRGQMNTSEIIKFLCKGQGVSMSELARRIGQTRQNLCKKLERETLTVEEINQIAAVLGGKFEQVFTLPNGMHINTDVDAENSVQSKSETIIKALWNFTEIQQNKDVYDYNDIQRLIELFRYVYELDVVYVIEINPDNNSYIYRNIACSDSRYNISGIDLDLSEQDYEEWKNNYDEEKLCFSTPVNEISERKSVMHYGCFRENELDGSVGFIDYHNERKWTREEKDNLLRLGRTLHHIITSSRLEKLNVEINRKMDVLKAMASIYLTVHVLDLETDECEEFSSCSYVTPYTGNHLSGRQQLHDSLYYNCTLNDRDNLMEFADVDTLDERLKDKKSVAFEFRGLHMGWTRARFVVVERNEFGSVKRVAFTTQVIDAEKRKMAELLHKSSTDELTQLNNRNAYETDIKSIEVEGMSDDLIVVAFDVNGLKTANDDIGHEAGDELIRGTAFCITCIFGMAGKIYRTGGDEFMCIMKGSTDELADMMQNLKDIQKDWKGTLVNELSISAGYASVAEFPGKSFHELLTIADKRMYDDKREFYRTSGKDRRRR